MASLTRRDNRSWRRYVGTSRPQRLASLSPTHTSSRPYGVCPVSEPADLQGYLPFRTGLGADGGRPWMGMREGNDISPASSECSATERPQSSALTSLVYPDTVVTSRPRAHPQTPVHVVRHVHVNEDTITEERIAKCRRCVQRMRISSACAASYSAWWTTRCRKCKTFQMTPNTSPSWRASSPTGSCRKGSQVIVGSACEGPSGLALPISIAEASRGSQGAVHARLRRPQWNAHVNAVVIKPPFVSDGGDVVSCDRGGGGGGGPRTGRWEKSLANMGPLPAGARFRLYIRNRASIVYDSELLLLLPPCGVTLTPI